MDQAIERAVREFEDFVHRYDEPTLKQWLDSLVDQFDSRAFVGRGYGARLARVVRRLIVERMPASLVRLGDGEGNVLAVYDPDFPELSTLSTNRIWRLMFARSPPESIESISIQIAAASANADVLGVPDAGRIAVVYRSIRDHLQQRDYDLRGLSGTINALRYAQDLLLSPEHLKSGRVITNCFFHRDLLPHYDRLIGGLPTVGLISCYDELPGLVRDRFHVQQVEFYEVPAQASNIRGRPEKEHYPYRFQQIMKNLTIGCRGQVVLVAAGILGKIYCDRVKALGGIGIDIGSVADVWAGRSVRAYHTTEFVEKWHI